MNDNFWFQITVILACYGHFGNSHFGRKYQWFWPYNGHFGGELTVVLVIKLTAIFVKNNGHATFTQLTKAGGSKQISRKSALIRLDHLDAIHLKMSLDSYGRQLNNYFVQ